MPPTNAQIRNRYSAREYTFLVFARQWHCGEIMARVVDRTTAGI